MRTTEPPEMVEVMTNSVYLQVRNVIYVHESRRRAQYIVAFIRLLSEETLGLINSAALIFFRHDYKKVDKKNKIAHCHFSCAKFLRHHPNLAYVSLLY